MRRLCNGVDSKSRLKTFSKQLIFYSTFRWERRRTVLWTKKNKKKYTWKQRKDMQALHTHSQKHWFTCMHADKLVGGCSSPFAVICTQSKLIPRNAGVWSAALNSSLNDRETRCSFDISFFLQLLLATISYCRAIKNKQATAAISTNQSTFKRFSKPELHRSSEDNKGWFDVFLCAVPQPDGASFQSGFQQSAKRPGGATGG